MPIATLDFETFYDTGYGLRGMTTEEYIRDSRFEVIGFAIKIDDGATQWYSGTHEELLFWLRQYDWSTMAMVAHNARFDAAILSWRFGIQPKMYMDTLSMARNLIGLLTGLSLEKLGRYWNLPLFKGHEVVNAFGLRRLDFDTDQLHRYGAYCINDVDMTYHLAQIMVPMTIPSELKLQDWTIRCYAEPKVAIDAQVLRDEIIAYNARKGSLLEAAGISDISVLRSDESMARALVAIGVEPPVKLSPKQKNADGSRKTVYAFSKQDVEFMDLLDSDDEPTVALVEARLGLKSSILSTRLERMVGLAGRGLLPVPMDYCGAVPTKRWAGSENINIQNFPRSKKNAPSPLRRSLIAPRGKRMAAADLSQIELRVNCWQSGQRNILDLLRRGEDAYSHMATDIFGFEVDKDLNPVERFVGKTATLGCGYQCGGPKFSHMLKVDSRKYGVPLADTSVEFATGVVTAYRENNRFIRGFWYKAQDALQSLAFGMHTELGPYTIRDSQVLLPNGSSLYYPDLRYLEKEGDDEQGCEWSYERELKGRKIRKKIYGGLFVENITQAVARLFVSDALLRLETIKYPDGRRVFDVVFSVHDELVVLFDEGLDESWVRDTLRWAMTTPPVWALDIPLACDIGIGQNYAETK